MSGVEDYMSVTSESQYTPVMNFIAEANPIQANSGTRKRKKPLKVKSKSIKNQKELVAADNNGVNLFWSYFSGNSTIYSLQSYNFLGRSHNFTVK